MTNSPIGNRNPISPAKRLHTIFNKYGKAVHHYFEREKLCADIPSHDFSHHLRVWHNCVDIAEKLYREGFSFSDRFLTQLTIAALIHDSGLTLNKGVKHGQAGADICEKFLSENGIEDEDREEIKKAIIYHDDKEYLLSHPPESLLSIVSVADDVDAFGYTGIYRYIEIYLKRGINTTRLADEIVLNAYKRMINIKRVYGFLNDFIEEQEIRFNILRHFFTNNDNRAAETREAIIGEIKKMVLNKHKSVIPAHIEEMSKKGSLSAPFFNMLLQEFKIAGRTYHKYHTGT